MKMRSMATSPYARKVLVMAHETGLLDRLELLETDVWAKDSDIAAVNPLGKVPALTTDSGTLLVDSPVICEYLDSLHNGPTMIPRAGPDRWSVLRLQAIADGIMDAAVLKVLELRRRQIRRSAGWIARQTRAIHATLDLVEEEIANFDGKVDLGSISLACALGYIDLRLTDENWRAGRSALAAWYAGFSSRPSMQATAPHGRR